MELREAGDLGGIQESNLGGFGSLGICFFDGVGGRFGLEMILRGYTLPKIAPKMDAWNTRAGNCQTLSF